MTSNSRLSWNNVYLLDVLGEMLRQVSRPEFDQFRGLVTDKEFQQIDLYPTAIAPSKKVLTDELEFCETCSHNVNKMRQILKLFSLLIKTLLDDKHCTKFSQPQNSEKTEKTKGNKVGNFSLTRF